MNIRLVVYREGASSDDITVYYRRVVIQRDIAFRIDTAINYNMVFKTNIPGNIVITRVSCMAAEGLVTFEDFEAHR